MSKKHFIELAKILHRYKHSMTNGHFNELVHDIASMCKRANPSFDYTRFKHACKGE